MSTLRSWLSLPDEEARIVASSYDSVMGEMPGEMAMRRVSTVQTVVLNFEAEEEEQLRELIPNVFAGHPGRQKAKEMGAFQAAQPRANAKVGRPSLSKLFSRKS